MDKWNQLTASSKQIIYVVLVVIAIGFVWSVVGGEQKSNRGLIEEKVDTILYWTCSMHPQIKLPQSGACPICTMDLIPVKAGGSDEGERQLVMSPAAKKLAKIQTSPVERKFVVSQVRATGKVAYTVT